MCVFALVLVAVDPSQRTTLIALIPCVLACYGYYYGRLAWRRRHGAAEG